MATNKNITGQIQDNTKTSQNISASCSALAQKAPGQQEAPFNQQEFIEN